MSIPFIGVSRTISDAEVAQIRAYWAKALSPGMVPILELPRPPSSGVSYFKQINGGVIEVFT